MAKSVGIPMARFEEIIVRLEAAGLKVEDKAGWIKVEGPGGHRMYVAKQKEVRRVDLSGFAKGWAVPGLGILPPKEPNGRVYGRVDLEHPQALLHFEMLGMAMLTWPAPAPEERRGVGRKAAPKAAAEPKRAEALPLGQLSDDEKAKRKALIARVAKEKGVTVSPSAQ